MEVQADNEIPQWKKDLIARLRSQNRSAAGSGDQQQQQQQQLSASPQLSCGRAVRQPGKNESVSGVSRPAAGEPPCDVISTRSQHSKMVQERVWVDAKHDAFAEMVTENYNNNGYRKDSDSDSSEDLHYGPGIVNKLKNKYLSLALRESSRARPSIFHMRKATSLENLLDDGDDDAQDGLRGRQFQSRLNGNDTGRNIPNRYRNAARGEMKRARSVEAISRYDSHVPLVSNETRPNRQSLHEEMLIATEKEVNHRKMQDNQSETNAEGKYVSNNRINRPKRIQPIMNEKEKPPADVVKQAKMIFERRPEQRTKAPPQTGDVAAKVDSFNNIIVKAKVEAKVISKKPPVKQTKPVLNDKVKNTRPVAKPVIVNEEMFKSPPPKSLDLKVPKRDIKDEVPLASPIPDVSRIDFHKGDADRGRNSTSLSETPDLILVSSPLPASSPTFNKTEVFIKEEIRIISPLLSPRSPPILLSPAKRSPSPIPSPRPSPILSPKPSDVSDGAHKTTTFNFTNQNVNQSHLPVNKNVSTTKTPPSQPLKIEINGHHDAKISTSPPKLLLTQSPKSPPLPPPKKAEVKPLTVTEIEKNLINAAKTLQQPGGGGGGVVSVNSSVEVVNKIIVPKKGGGRPREPQSNTAVFNFTNRKDVPDYIANDRSRTPGRPELPKVNDMGIVGGWG